MEDIDISLVQRVDRLLIEGTARQQLRLKPVLELFIEKGFSSARLYHVIMAPANHNEKCLSLVEFAYANPITEPTKGYRIPFENSTIGLKGLTNRPAYGNHTASSGDEARFPWIAALGLCGHHWLDVPIKSHNEELGVLAVSWEGAPDLVSEESQRALMIISRLIANAQESITSGSIATITASMEPHLSAATHEITDTSLAQRMADLIKDQLRAQASAVFRYEWTQHRLIKVAESIDLKRHQYVRLDEKYDIDSCLTGKAWRRPEFRYIPHFAEFSKQPNIELDGPSVQWHRNNLGGIETVLYCQIGSGRDRYLVRLINRSDEPTLPFTSHQRSLLEAACAKLTSIVDSISTKALLDVLEQAAIIGLRNVDNLDDVFPTFIDHLRQCGLGDFAVLHASQSSKTLSYFYSSGAWFVGAKLPPMLRSDRGSFFDIAAQSIGLRDYSIDTFGKLSQDPIYQHCRKMNVKRLVACTAKHDSSLTVIIAPEGGCGARKSIAPLESRISLVEQKVLLGLTSIIGASIEAAVSNVSAEKAENLVGQLGHEIGGSIAALSQLAIASINKSIKLVRSADAADAEAKRNLEDALEAEKRKINSKSNAMHHQMNIAMTMAERSKGIINLKYEEFSWSDLTQAAWGEALDWARALDSRKSQRSIVLRPNKTLLDMRGVGDRTILHAALCNILKNAIKYSLPRRSNLPMEVEVMGQPQIGWQIVQVRNWGIGIDGTKKEAIFRRFYRIERADRVRAIGGIGLGLYLTRLLLEAHEGEIFCLESESTLDDPERISAWEGFLTTFELRLPRSLSPGVYQATLPSNNGKKR